MGLELSVKTEKIATHNYHVNFQNRILQNAGGAETG